jgi:hypothetical protein
MNGASAALLEHLGTLEDLRAKHLTEHKLVEVIAVAI